MTSLASVIASYAILPVFIFYFSWVDYDVIFEHKLLRLRE